MATFRFDALLHDDQRAFVAHYQAFCRLSSSINDEHGILTARARLPLGSPGLAGPIEEVIAHWEGLAVEYRAQEERYREAGKHLACMAELIRICLQ
jgi:hypothetical protein